MSSSGGINTDFWAGILFTALGVFFCLASVSSLDLGNAFRMGPGYFPALLGGLLAVTGIIIVAKAILLSRHEDVGSIPWRAIVLIPLGFIGFGFAVRPIGLAPATFVLALLAASASAEMRLSRAVLVASIMTTMCILIFSMMLGLKTPLLGDWLR